MRNLAFPMVLACIAAICAVPARADGPAIIVNRTGETIMVMVPPHARESVRDGATYEVRGGTGFIVHGPEVCNFRNRNGVCEEKGPLFECHYSDSRGRQKPLEAGMYAIRFNPREGRADFPHCIITRQ